jgi:RecA/RadA recombinase
VPPRSPSGVGRLVIESLGSLDWCSCSQQQQEEQALQEQQMLQALAQLRLLVQDSYCSVLVTCPAGECMYPG